MKYCPKCSEKYNIHMMDAFDVCPLCKNLLIEKVILISVPTSPLILSIQEYGENDIDANFDLFIASNVLKNTEILLLPAGRTVVVYV